MATKTNGARCWPGFHARAWHATAAPALVAYEEKLTERNPLYMFKALTEQLPNVQFQVLEQCGHQLMLENRKRC